MGGSDSVQLLFLRSGVFDLELRPRLTTHPLNPRAAVRLLPRARHDIRVSSLLAGRDVGSGTAYYAGCIVNVVSGCNRATSSFTGSLVIGEPV